MFKISLINGRSQRRLIVEGTLIAPWAAELKKACDSAREDLDGRDFIVDLKQLMAISKEGEDLIVDLMSDGVKFRSHGLYDNKLLRQLARRSRASMSD
jgi:hypothetical protein